MRVLFWTLASAGDGGGEKHSMGDEVRRPRVVARRRDAVFELSSGAGRREDVAETSGCLALAGEDGPIENLLEYSATSKERYD